MENLNKAGPGDLSHMISTSDPAQAMLSTDVHIY